MLLQDAHEGDKAAREQLVRENMGLVYAVVQRFAGRRSCEKEDLIQIGSIGLMKAIDRFDLTYEVCLTTRSRHTGRGRSWSGRMAVSRP